MKKTAEQGQLIAVEDRQSRKRTTSSKKANDLDGRKWLRNSISIWSDLRKTPEETSLKHPAMFPVQLVNRLIESFTRSDQTVILDPFSGIGSTVLAAEMLGKQGIGFEISPEYIAKAWQRPLPNADLFEGIDNDGAGERHFYEADARDLLQYVAADSVDFVVTSPPIGIFCFRTEQPTTRKFETTVILIRTWGESPITGNS